VADRGGLRVSAVANAPASSSSFSAARAFAARHPWALRIAGLAAIMLLSVSLRTHALTAKFWIDEGLSVGIAHHSFLDIPGVLRKDGSPPLYYMLLHVWMGVVGGDGESRTHALSVLCATLTIPAAWFAGRRLFGERAAWASAALCATLPFLTYYAQETRMYALVALLGTCSSGAFAIAYARRERWAIPLFSVLTALTVYTHNWGLFLAVGMGVAFLVLWRTAPAAERGALFRDGVYGFGLLLVLYAPWIPTLLFQAKHTGAPWAEAPDFNGLLNGAQNLVGGVETSLLLLVIGVAGVLTLRAGAQREQWRGAVALGVALLAGIGLAWLSSQASPAWSVRYFSVFIGPALLLAGAGATRFGKVGLVVLAIVLVLWFDPRERQLRSKSDAYRVATILKQTGAIQQGDLVVAVHPEYGPVMRYYLGGGYQWADALGKVSDNRIFDWRDALDRFKAAGPKRTLRTLEPLVAPGQRLVLILPIIRTASWGAPWTSQIRKRSPQWETALDRSADFTRVGPVPKFKRRALPRGVRAVVYERK
jgi:mannosyltransferase